MIFIFMDIVMIMSFTFVRFHCNIIERKIVSGKWKMFASVCFYRWFASTTPTTEYKPLLCFLVLVPWRLGECVFTAITCDVNEFDGNRFVCIFIECSFWSILRDAYQIHRFSPYAAGWSANWNVMWHFWIHNLLCVDAHQICPQFNRI